MPHEWITEYTGIRGIAGKHGMSQKTNLVLTGLREFRRMSGCIVSIAISARIVLRGAWPGGYGQGGYGQGGYGQGAWPGGHGQHVAWVIERLFALTVLMGLHG